MRARMLGFRFPLRVRVGRWSGRLGVCATPADVDLMISPSIAPWNWPDRAERVARSSRRPVNRIRRFL